MDALQMQRGSRGLSPASDFDARGLFIVGHARSGTSILQDALNSSADVYLLGEANLHLSASRTNFVDWYNAMHRQLGNPEYKGSYCPESGNESANGLDTLGALSRRFKYVGEKLAFRSEKLGYDFEGFLRFAARHFLRSAYVCALRNPLHVIVSCLDMFEEGARTREAVDMYAESYLRCMYLQLRTLFLFNRTYFVVHDRICENTFDALAAHLDVSLSEAWLFYDDRQVRRPLPEATGLEEFSSVGQVCTFYKRLVDEFGQETLRPRSLWNCRLLMYQLRTALASPLANQMTAV